MIHIKKLKQVGQLALVLLVLPLLSFNTSKLKLKQALTTNKKNMVVFSVEDLACYKSLLEKKPIKINKNGKIPNRINRIAVNVHNNHNHSAIPQSLVRHKPKSDSLHSLDTISNNTMETVQAEKSSISYQSKAAKGKGSLRPEIQAALHGLAEFDAPSIIITSTVRNWGGHGHRCGKAIDVNYTKTVTSWLLSAQGESWLKRYELEFYIEDFKRSSKQMLSPDEEKHWRWIGHATGLHIHINLK